MKRIPLLALFLFITSSSIAQSNFYKISAGGGVGLTQSFTEAQKHDFGLAGYGTLDYLFTPFLSLGLEIQKGEINGGDYQTDVRQRQFINSYTSFSANGRIGLGEFIDYNHNQSVSWLKGLYIGPGIGIIQNNPYYVMSWDEDTGELQTRKTTSKDIFFPLNLGINFYFADRVGFYRYVLNFNYQANITLDEKLDGYGDSVTFPDAGRPDIYTFFSVGLKYNFGIMGLSRKSFRGY
jgi:hypothetical protein